MYLLSKLKNKLIKEARRKILELNYIGPDCQIAPSAKILGSYLEGDITIGDRSKINRAELFGNVEVGTNSSLWGPNLDVYARINSVKIGNFCSIARNVSIQEYFHDHKRVSSYYILKNVFNKKNNPDAISRGDITIGHDVWIGTGSIILSGAYIGNGAVIGANSVVNGEIPDFAIAAGSPAKVIKYRFTDDLIAKLKELEWWNWSFERIKSNQDFFEGNLDHKKIRNLK